MDCVLARCLSSEWRDIDLRNGILKVQEGKGKKRRSVPITNTLNQVLEQARQKTNTPLPYSDRFAASYAFEIVCHQAGVMFQGKALHGLRHYAGTKAYQATHDILRVGKLLGHSKVETTARYAKILMSGFDETYLAEFRSMLLSQ